jgi:N-acetylmuramoyl-L-alanine amidase
VSLLGPLLVAAAALPGAGGATPAAPYEVARPHIVQRRIPFGARRRREMAAYSARHYGRRTYRLRNPHVIVEHYTANTSLSATINTFASDAADPELHERPGTCAHFVIDSGGTIYQLVPLRWRCRHTVGLNWTAIGIEHVGTSDAAVMSSPRVLRASLRLTRWLRCTDGIRVRDVIGHAESLSSPYHHERVRSLRTQTHGDMTHGSMQRYRRRLAKLGCGA